MPSDRETGAPRSPSRRSFLQQAAAGGGLGLAAMLAGCAPQGAKSAGKEKRLRAAFSNAGLASTWCSLGKTTAELWGDLLNVEVKWYDGEMNSERQREKIMGIVDNDWDFCCFQAVSIDILAEPARRLKERGVPVISMDTLLVELDKMRATGVWLEVTPDHVFMGESSTRYMMKKIREKKNAEKSSAAGKVIHIGGLAGHSGAQGRREGFERAHADFPDVQVLGGGVRWCDWEKEKARTAFESMLSSETEPIDGAFFHSDDMALACLPALTESSPHKNMIITAADGQKEGLAAIRKGKLAATTVNPVCLIHMTSLVIGQFIVRNQEKMDDLPLEIITPGPLVSQETGNLDAMFYLADPKHCLV